MEKANWRLNPFPKYSRWTLELDLNKSLDYLESNQSKNWKRNLRRSKKYFVSTQNWESPNKFKIIDLYTEMESYKRIKRQFTENQISNILKIIGDDLIIYKSSNESGDIIGIRGCVIFGNKALDFFAATNQEGRSKYVSYRLLWQIIIHCKEIGLESYDLHGIDIINNEGVYNFKKGTGASLIENLGEYDWATSKTLRKFIHLAYILKR
jgi:lipid II:glycine glycyltransferase (peptidoglycan interpeptide bridge formation enzyme)